MSQRSSPPLPSGEHDLILADPPWRYDSRWVKPSQGGMTYPTMSDDEICELPVGKLAAPRSVLMLWGTCPKIKSALRVMDAWGFRFTTFAFIWVKTYDDGMIVYPRGKEIPDESFAYTAIRVVCGLGRYTKTAGEYVLMGVRGKEIKVADLRVNQIIFAPRRKHSEKPVEIYKRLERMYPNARKLELFARRRHPGWTAWGNQLRKSKAISTEVMEATGATKANELALRRVLKSVETRS